MGVVIHYSELLSEVVKILGMHREEIEIIECGYQFRGSTFRRYIIGHDLHHEAKIATMTITGKQAEILYNECSFIKSISKPEP